MVIERGKRMKGVVCRESVTGKEWVDILFKGPLFLREV